MNKLNTIAKIIEKTNPEVFREAEKLCTPLLTDRKLIPEIYKRISEVFPEMDRTDQSIMFMACTYTAYAPATLLGPGFERAPVGIRSAICEVMNWNNETVCNHYQDLGRAYIKGAKFQERVSAVLLGLDKFSAEGGQSEIVEGL
ncbi:hypothetical protein [Pedobacter antarcticus]|uniref:hypothetical protein n=1 Tax=Pedobacter antarcticus TaxID=34086 RepID=UPI001C564476|nr:hypothetical protein [Pedobacter antarcticus]